MKKDSHVESTKKYQKTKAEKPTADKPKQSQDFPITSKDLLKLIFTEDKHPQVKVEAESKRIYITFKKAPDNIKGSLDKYTDDLRKSFIKAKMEGWRVYFYVNGIRYLSTMY